MYQNYYPICDHHRLQRIDDNFVRCLQCGQSLISQKLLPNNKSRRDFIKENKNFDKNFDRNFTNVLEEIDTSKPVYDYYTDKMKANKIIVNRQAQFSSSPAKYEVIVNHAKYYLTEPEIKKLLSDINAVHLGRFLKN